MLIPLAVSLVSSVSHVLCCILEQLRGVLPAPLTLGMQAALLTNPSANPCCSVAFPLSLHFSIFLLGWGKRKHKKKSHLRSGFPGEFEEKVQVFSSGLCTNTLFQAGNPSVRLPLVHYQSLECRLRCRLNNNFPSMASFLLAICTLWTCHTASLFYS